MNNGKDHHTRQPQNDANDGVDIDTLPPPYTPTDEAPSPRLTPNQEPYAGTSASVARAPLPPHHPTYQSFSPANQPYQYQARLQHFPQGSPPMQTSPLIMSRAATRIQDLKNKPAMVICQHCRHLVLTDTTTENGRIWQTASAPLETACSCTYVGVLALFLLGVTTFGCCLLPLCLTSCKDVMHSCPNCERDIGLYSRIKERTFPVRTDPRD
ncbi:cell death-inducing p53 target 1 [Mortierella alpina]|nr:cell death-inducing p53 target 1 [Mortierella alpina]